MKTKALLFLAHSLLSLILCAQDLNDKVIQPNISLPDGEYFKPASRKFALAPMMVPSKTDMVYQSTSVWKWDTIECFNAVAGSNPFQRIIRSYNSMGMPLTQLHERLQDGFTWQNYARETFTWDSAGNWLSYLAEQWQNNTWVNDTKQTFEYDSESNMVDWKRETWQTNYWKKMWHYNWHYNSTGINDTTIYQTGQDSLWINCELGINFYDANDFVDSVLVYAWTSNNWVVSRRVSYTHDLLGNYLTSLAQNWQNGSWMNYSLSIQTFDTVGRNLTSLFQLWQTNTWVNIFDYSYSYDSAGNMTSSVRRDWSGNSWENSNQNFYVYDGWNNLISITYQTWNISSWRNTYREQYTYDSSGNSLTGKYLKWYAGDWHPEVGSLSVFADHQKDTYVNLPNLYRYEAKVDSVMVASEPSLTPGQINLYPNPALSMVHVSVPPASGGHYGTLTLFNLQGQVVFSKQLNTISTAIDVSGLKPGVYFVRFRNNQTTSAIKLVKN